MEGPPRVHVLQSIKWLQKCYCRYGGCGTNPKCGWRHHANKNFCHFWYNKQAHFQLQKHSRTSCLKTSNTQTRLTAHFPGLPRWARTRKVKPIWILLKRQWVALASAGNMQVCTSLQIDNHASTPPLFFYRLDALPAAQPTASKHWTYCTTRLFRCILMSRFSYLANTENKYLTINKIPIVLSFTFHHEYCISQKCLYSMQIKFWWRAILAIHVYLISQFYSIHENRENQMNTKYSCFTVVHS